MASAALTLIRAHWPNAFITLMLPQHFTGLFEKDPRVNEVFGFSVVSGFYHRQVQRQTILKIRQGKYDLGVLLTNSFSSAYWFWQAGVRLRAGYRACWRHALLTHSIKFSSLRTKQHLVTTYNELVWALGAPRLDALPALFMSDEEKEQARAILHPEIRWIGFNTQAAYGPAKCWPQECFEELIVTLLKDRTIGVVLFGDKKSAPYISTLFSACQKRMTHAGERLLNLAGTTNLRQLMAAISVCQLFVSNDSGPMHLAAALNVPVVAIFGSTDPVVTGPLGRATILYKAVHCSPCFKRVCPIDFRCMHRIEVREVLNAIEQYISYRRTSL